ncbi:complement component C8 gamma chain [Chanos chanos]|uniref:Complement component C8 gamma chain n=1 Tax=Chanos chanos TaxID=29144 RepID=A0A6J2UT76_CHACN|nr:complement component C8 gamma chain [Chanos chanos]
MMRVWLCFALVGLFGDVRARGPCRKGKETPIDKIAPVENFNIQQMSGKWYLVSAASKCQYLLENSFSVEGTIINLTPSKSTLSVSTLRKFNYQCWEIRQIYQVRKPAGRLFLKGPYSKKDVDIVIGDTDYSSYAIVYFQRHCRIAMKLYGRTPELPDAVVDKFEELAKKQNLGLDVVFQFPTYGFCESADKDHTLDMT